MKRLSALLGWLLLGAPAWGHAQAVEPLMAEPIGYTDVLDAFDGDDPLDVSVTLSFHRLLQSGTIHREVADDRTVDGRSTRAFIEVTEHERTSNELGLSLELGLYHDLMLFGHLPILLGEQRSLSLPGAERCRAGAGLPELCDALVEPLPGGGAEQPLFAQQVQSAKRSGVPSITLGLAWSPLNQHRGASFATWTLRAATSIAVGPVMKPCLAEGDCSAGVSRGTAGLELESRWSYRVRHFAPYLGIGHRLEWVSSGDEVFAPRGELPGDVDPEPPSVTSGTLGLAVIPWEDRGRYQRFAIDARGRAAMVSQGRDFTPLFDALGSSDHLAVPRFDREDEGDPQAVAVPFTGLTHVQAHAELGLSLSLIMQAARYVRFTVGARLQYLTPHLLTGAPSCNLGAGAASDDPRRGDCSRGLINPSHRPLIDAPGGRFRLDSDVLLDLSLSAAGQF